MVGDMSKRKKGGERGKVKSRAFQMIVEETKEKPVNYFYPELITDTCFISLRSNLFINVDLIYQ